MDDFFDKNIMPLARPKFRAMDNLPAKSEIESFDRWKFVDRFLYNKAIRVNWTMKDIPSNQNWTEFQRRAKHLFAAWLELETVLEWISESVNVDHLRLIKLTEDLVQTDKDPVSFWLWTEEIREHRTGATIFQHPEHAKNEFYALCSEAMTNYANTGVDHFIIDVKKKLNEVMVEVYDLVVCRTPWIGRIENGPMLPEQDFVIFMNEGQSAVCCKYEFLIIGARRKDLGWLRELKIPALSETSQLTIHYGTRKL